MPGETLLAAGEQWLWTPPANTSGDVAALTVRVTDGSLASPDAVPVIIDVVCVNHPPELAAGVLDGAKQGVPFAIDFSSLAAAPALVDSDGDALVFRFEQLQSGTFATSGGPVQSDATLGAGGGEWVWTGDALGDIAAFTVSASDGSAITAPMQVTIRVARSRLSAEWVGGTAVASGWATTGWSSAGASDGILAYPKDVVAVDESGQLRLYVVDGGNNRVVKLDAVSGTLLVWVGAVDLAPTGGAVGCTSASFGNVTPGWCLGGTPAQSAAPGGLDFPRRLALAGTSLYVTDTYGITEFDLPSGALVGKITGVEIEGREPPAAYGLAIDATYIYVTPDNFTGAVVRINLSDGKHDGWLGGVATAPASCIGTLPALHTFSGSWWYGRRRRTWCCERRTVGRFCTSSSHRNGACHETTQPCESVSILRAFGDAACHVRGSCPRRSQDRGHLRAFARAVRPLRRAPVRSGRATADP